MSYNLRISLPTTNTIRFLGLTETESIPVKGRNVDTARLLFLDSDGKLVALKLFANDIHNRSKELRVGSVYNLCGLVWKDITLNGLTTHQLAVNSASQFK